MAHVLNIRNLCPNSATRPQTNPELRNLDPNKTPASASRPLTAKLLKNATLKTYEGFPHGMPTTQADTINADLLTWTSPEIVEACTMRSSHARNTKEVRSGVP